MAARLFALLLLIYLLATARVPPGGLIQTLATAPLMAAAGALFHVLCRRRGAGPGWAVVLTLALGLCTICFPYGRSGGLEALQTLALLLVYERGLSVIDRPAPLRIAALAVALG